MNNTATEPSFSRFKDRVLWQSLVGVVTAIVLWATWATISILNRPTAAQSVDLVKTHAPYNEDRRLVLQAIEENKQANKELRAALDNNTRAITRLQAFLEKRGM